MLERSGLPALRPFSVVIYMLGDHVPAIINILELESLGDEALTEVKEREVPYVIWANYPVAFPEQPELKTVTDLVPSMLQTAGLPLSEYYRLLLRLHEEIPARTLHGYYLNWDGSTGLLAEHPAYEDLKRYYELEYNGLDCGRDYRADLFLP